MTDKEAQDQGQSQKVPVVEPLQLMGSPAAAASCNPQQLNPPMSGGSTTNNMISVTVAPFTGGPFVVNISKKESVEELKKAVAKRLKVLKDRICLLYRESQLNEGTLEDNFVVDGSRITLLPRAETGLLAQKPEQSVMQALESLNDNQVVDFLSGKAPLNLTMRLGDHMMLIQLRLSTVNSSSHGRRSRAQTSHGSSIGQGSSSTSTIYKPVSSPLYNRPNVSSSSMPAGRAAAATTSTHAPSMSGPSSPTTPDNASYKPRLDTVALAEASKNLTQTLRQLSSEVLTTKSDEEKPRNKSKMHSTSYETGAAFPSSSSTTSKREAGTSRTKSEAGSSSTTSYSKARHSSNNLGSGPSTSGSSSSGSSGSGSNVRSGGAIIESMHHHGKGVYSGTFSGTLNPALQDRNGQPKRDITTIIHILNDLLCAQYKSYQPTSSSSKATSTASSSSSAKVASSVGLPCSPNSNLCKCRMMKPGVYFKHQQQRLATASEACDPRTVNKDVTMTSVENPDQQKLTRKKMEEIRRIMEIRKQRRRERREARAAPYSTSWSLKSSDTSSSHGPQDEAMEESPSPTSGANQPTTNSSGNNTSDIFNPELEPVTA